VRVSGDEIDEIIAREVAMKALANERVRRVAWRIVETRLILPLTDRKAVERRRTGGMVSGSLSLPVSGVKRT
jgi:hypothetical protein